MQSREEMENNKTVVKFMDFVKRLPLSDEQRLEFVKGHIERIKAEQQMTVVAKECFKKVMVDINGLEI